MYDTVIANGTVVTSAAVYPADVGFVGERIAAVGSRLQGERTVDAAGCLVIPGGVDVHVHLQMRAGQFTSSDTFWSGTRAAACGGTTTVVDFVEPQTAEPMLEALGKRRAEADPQMAIDYGLHMTLPAWHVDHELERIPEVMAAGVYSFKLYQAYGPLCLEDTRLYAALRALQRFAALPILHSENGPVIDRLRSEALAAGHVEPIWHAVTRPASLEAEAVGRAIELARQAGAPLYVVHVSCAESLEVISAARRRGRPVFGETCPQYLYLTQEMLAGPHGERFVCAPPLRSAADQRELWGALGRGELQVVSTDHCPFFASDKAAGLDFTRVPGGIPSIEARLSLIHKATRDGTVGLRRWVEACCTAPASLFRLPRKGHIAPGFDADLAVWAEKPMELTAERLHERVDWSPYEGLSVAGWPRHVFSRGQQVVHDGEYVGQQGHGRFLAAGGVR